MGLLWCLPMAGPRAEGPSVHPRPAPDAREDKGQAGGSVHLAQVDLHEPACRGGERAKRHPVNSLSMTWGEQHLPGRAAS